MAPCHALPSRLEAAIASIAEAAALVDEGGRVIAANDAARAFFASGGRLPYTLCEAASRTPPADGAAWTITSVGPEREGAREYLLVLRVGGEAALREQVQLAGERWELTRRKRDVLRMVVEGYANQTIASVLGVSTRTVELHVTGLLDRAGVSSRCALSARVFTLR